MANWYKDRYDVDLDPNSEVIATIGSKKAGTLSLGDLISRRHGISAQSGTPVHPYGFVSHSAEIRHVPIGPDSDFFELESAIRNTFPKPKMLVLNFPANPTAQCVELDFFEKVVAIARNIRFGSCRIWPTRTSALTVISPQYLAGARRQRDRG